MDYETLLIGVDFWDKTLAAEVHCSLCRKVGPDADSEHWTRGYVIGYSAGDD